MNITIYIRKFFPSLCSFSSLTPSCTKNVASLPSSTIISGPVPSGQTSALYVQSQYSSRVSPFHAKTFVLSDAAIAAAHDPVLKKYYKNTI